MTAQAHYSATWLGIYITKRDMDLLIIEGEVVCQVYLGNVKIPASFIYVRADQEATDIIAKQLLLDRAVYKNVPHLLPDWLKQELLKGGD